MTRPSGDRGMDAAELAAALDGRADIVSDPPAALARARRLAGRRGLVCVCGSLRLIGEVLRSCGHRRLDVI
jgi:folylpolyglutamate synthase/dihydropteroate synthase